MAARKPPEAAAGADRPARGSRRQPTLRARALRLLARREHSRAELRQRLVRYASSESELEAVLDECEQRRWQSDARFALTYVGGRAARFGALRLRYELAARGIDDQRIRQALGGLDEDEVQRAFRVWRKRFSAPATDLAERARQVRFLAQRGFAAETIRRALRQAAQLAGTEVRGQQDDLADFVDPVDPFDPA
ncbi:MAG: recombination regulator RecX [Burkholderiales bacterium]|nr:MAG: recombination regulator RecX [Burkholderiales bacterium]